MAFCAEQRNSEIGVLIIGADCRVGWMFEHLSTEVSAEFSC